MLTRRLADDEFDEAWHDCMSMRVSSRQIDDVDLIPIEDFPSKEEMIAAEDNFYNKTKVTPEWDYKRPRRNRTDEPRERDDRSKTFGHVGIKYKKRGNRHPEPR